MPNPVATSAWEPGTPLTCGLAVRLDEDGATGTLGLGLEIAGAHYFTASRHVVGSTTSARQVEIWTVNETWRPVDLFLLPAAEQPADSLKLAKLDLSFLRCEASARNDPPGALAVAPACGVFAAGSVFSYRGIRDEVRELCTFVDRYDGAAHADSFEPGHRLNKNLRHFTVVDLGRTRPADDLRGNSGAILWGDAGSDRLACHGHLYAVSRVDGLAMVVDYLSAFPHLGIYEYRILGAESDA